MTWLDRIQNRRRVQPVKWRYAMTAELSRMTLPPRPKPRSWTSEFYRISTRGQPRERVDLVWKRKEIAGASWRDVLRALSLGRRLGRSRCR